MKDTPKEFVRRGGLMAWLGSRGLPSQVVRDLIEAGEIQARHFPHCRRGTKRRAKASKQHPKLIKGRAWFHTPTIAAKLNIDL